MFQEDFTLDISIWRPETDTLVTDATPLLNEKSSFCSAEYFRWAYSLNTSAGLFRKNIVQGSPNTTKITFEASLATQVILPGKSRNDLVLDTGMSCNTIMSDVNIWPTQFFESFMVFTSNMTNQTFLIDSRGIIFELPCDSSLNLYKTSGSVGINKRDGYYLINNVKVRFRTNVQQKEFSLSCRPISNAHFNKSFNSFVRKNAHNRLGYLYLTSGESKCGSFISYFSSLGMKYEIVPNILEDDDTINIRIPLDSENASRRDVQFLCTKYKNTYSIYGVSIESVGSGFSAFWNWNLRQDELRFCMPKGKEPLIYSIADTLRLACNSTSDHDVYIKVFSKVSRLFSNGSERPTVNEFSNLLLLYPTGPQVTDLYIYEHLQYINTLLGIKQSTTNQTKLKFISRMANNGFSIDCIKKIFPELVQEYSYRILPFDYSPSLNTTRTYNKELYQLAYTASVKNYKEHLSTYESSNLQEMHARGFKISKWKSESSLFILVSKEYPDAIYQYHCDWLARQSLDIYIPSLHIGIEYQGEQHYRSVEFFGGDLSYQATIKRDLHKAQLCKEHGVHLIHWKYDEALSKTLLHQKINEILVT